MLFDWGLKPYLVQSILLLTASLKEKGWHFYDQNKKGIVNATKCKNEIRILECERDGIRQLMKSLEIADESK